jgi:hypothetical protein
MPVSRHPGEGPSDAIPADAPEADVEEQREPVTRSTPDPVVALRVEDPEVPEADALEQAMEVPVDDDAERR